MRSVPEVSVAALAYLGDSILEVCVRTYLVSERGISSSAKLNRAALSFVTATAQSEAVGRIEPHLTEEEAGYYHRGRNSGQDTYRKAPRWESTAALPAWKRCSARWRLPVAPNACRNCSGWDMGWIQPMPRNGKLR